MRRLLAIGGMVLLAAATAGPRPVSPAIAAWAFPEHRALPPPGGWDATPHTVAGSAATYTTAQLHNLQTAIDWFPARHPPMPAVVAVGRPPAVKACGFCHQPDGVGRPENASLAGLPASYIAAQVTAFANGSRAAAVLGWSPTHMMAEIARAASPAEIAAAAAYFAARPFKARLKVVETADVPRTEAQTFMLIPIAGGGREPIGSRIIETPVDVDDFERRDPAASIVAYVPLGSVARGATVAARVGCAGCHGASMALWGAGRSPTYIVRQLLAFRTGARHDAEAAPMTAVAAQLGDRDIIAVAAYFASRPS